MTIAIGAGGRDTTVIRAGKFGLVGAFGLLVNLLAQSMAIEFGGVNYLLAAVLATQVSSTVNFLIADSWVFESDLAANHRSRRYGSFLGMNNAALVLRAPVMWMLTSVIGLHYSVSNLLSLLMLTVLRFAVADRMIWRSTTADADVLAPDPPAGPPPSIDVSPDDWIEWDESLEATDIRSARDADMRGPSATTQRVGLLAILVVGAFLRTWRLTAVGYNSDEAVYASQAAGIAGDRSLAEFFPVFRAHPLLFQAILSVPYRFGTGDAVGRLLSAGFGLATIVVVFCTARLLYGGRVGLVAAGLVALMPYHVIITRQVLLDGPMAFFATLTLYFLARFVASGKATWLLAAGGGLGLTTLAKETYIILIGAVFLFFALSPEIRVRMRHVVLSLAMFFLVLVPFPITMMMAGKSETGKNYLAWQLFRRSNHGFAFYPATLPSFVGHAVLIGAVVAVVARRGRMRTWRERLLLSWIIVPVVFFEIWPVKGFHYLLAAAMPLAIVAADGLCQLSDRLSVIVRRRRLRDLNRHTPVRAVNGVHVALALVVSLSLAVTSWVRIQPATGESFLAGTGGVPGGREVGQWIDANVPEGAELLTIGPSMANIIQYYGHRKAFGLSVSPNPLNRNPSYQPIVNPDLAIRSNNLQYVVWDSYSTSRSTFFGSKLIAYAERYHGRIVHTYESGDRPIIVIYEVRP